MTVASIRERFRYRLDNFLAGGSSRLFGYKPKALEGDASRNYGVSLGPPTDQLVTIPEYDGLVAEDER